MSTKHTPVQWEIVDSGSPDYLDGIEAQFQIKDGVMGWARKEADR